MVFTCRINICTWININIMTDINYKENNQIVYTNKFKGGKIDLERLIKDIHSNAAIFNHISKSN